MKPVPLGALALSFLTFSVASLSAATTTLTGTVRDFKIEHPDFEDFLGSDPGIVETTLGADGKPAYAGTAGNPTTTSEANFDQWYNDVAGVNIPSPLSITLSDVGHPGLYTYDNGAFFPIDGVSWGNEGLSHNYHFTFELHTTFTYSGGEDFTFTGDDDLWVFINGKLAIDLGGVHGALTSSVDLDTIAAAHGLVPGGTYDLDLFFAERHTVASSFRIDTTIPLVTAVPDAGGTLVLLGFVAGCLGFLKRRA
jgi:fibro-slime domain-containing protein